MVPLGDISTGITLVILAESWLELKPCAPTAAGYWTKDIINTRIRLKLTIADERLVLDAISILF